MDKGWAGDFHMPFGTPQLFPAHLAESIRLLLAAIGGHWTWPLLHHHNIPVNIHYTIAAMGLGSMHLVPRTLQLRLDPFPRNDYG
jgi:hypothetical protein